MQEYTLNNFTKYTQWSSENQSGDCVIGVFGKCTMLNEFKTLAAKRTIGSPKIIVKEILNAADVEACHVLFELANKSDSISGLKEAVAGKSTLFITEKEGLGKQVIAINFVRVDGLLKYGLNKSAMDKAGLKAQPDPETSAILVKS